MIHIACHPSQLSDYEVPDRRRIYQNWISGRSGILAKCSGTVLGYLETIRMLMKFPDFESSMVIFANDPSKDSGQNGGADSSAGDGL